MMTLAQLYAVGAFLRPGQVGSLAPVLALIPLYATRHGSSIEAVWQMPAGDAVRALTDMLPEVVTAEVQQQMPAVEAEIREALDAQRIGDRMRARAA